MNDPLPVLKQFDYRPHRWKTVGLFLLAFGGTVLLTYFAIAIDEPLRVRGFQLSQTQARILFGAFAALSPIGLFGLGAMVYVAFVFDRRVALTDKQLILPRPTRLGLSRQEIQIPWDAISQTSVCDFIGTTKLLRLIYAGRVVNIPSNMFRRRAEFDELCLAVQKAVAKASRDPRQGKNAFPL